MSPAAEAQMNPNGAVPDTALLDRMARGDQEALGELRARYTGTLYALVYGLLGNAPDAEHVLSETFLEAWRSAPSYEASLGSVHTWLAEMVKRRTHGFMRERDARRTPWRAQSPAVQQHSL